MSIKNIGKCELHTERKNRHCLRCFLPAGAKNLRQVGQKTYLVDVGETILACEQDNNGWHEVSPPRS